MRYDLHVHTHLSDCASREAFFPLYIKAAEENRQTLLGFADHSWASGVEGATPWYRKQPFERLAEQKKQLTDYLAEHPSPVKVLQGAEGEFANFLLGIDEAAAQRRMNAGKTDEFYKSKTAHIIYNDGDEQSFVAEFSKLLNLIGGNKYE